MPSSSLHSLIFYSNRNRFTGDITFHKGVHELTGKNAGALLDLGRGIECFIERQPRQPGDPSFEPTIEAYPRKLFDLHRDDLKAGPTLELDKKIDLQLLYHCTSFFETPSDFNSRRVPKQSPPTSRYTALPIEVQLEVLDKMTIHEADDAVRQNFLHLIPRWIQSVPQRFERWLNDLTSLKNLRHLGCINYPGFSRDDQTVPLSLYRLQSIYFHPSTEIGPSTLISPPPSQDPKAAWREDVDKFFKLGLLALFDDFLGSDADLSRILRNKRDPDCGCYGSRPCRRCPGASHSDIYAMALSQDPSKPTKANPTPPYLLLYRDELVEIFKSFQVATRPGRLRDKLRAPLYNMADLKPELPSWSDLFYRRTESPVKVGLVISEDLRENGETSLRDIRNDRDRRLADRAAAPAPVPGAGC